MNTNQIEKEIDLLNEQDFRGNKDSALSWKDNSPKGMEDRFSDFSRKRKLMLSMKNKKVLPNEYKLSYKQNTLKLKNSNKGVSIVSFHFKTKDSKGKIKNESIKFAVMKPNDAVEFCEKESNLKRYISLFKKA